MDTIVATSFIEPAYLAIHLSDKQLKDLAILIAQKLKSGE